MWRMVGTNDWLCDQCLEEKSWMCYCQHCRLLQRLLLQVESLEKVVEHLDDAAYVDHVDVDALHCDVNNEGNGGEPWDSEEREDGDLDVVEVESESDEVDKAVGRGRDGLVRIDELLLLLQSDEEHEGQTWDDHLNDEAVEPRTYLLLGEALHSS